MPLEIDQVSVRFEVAALTEVTVTAAEGAITGLIGPNGAGKTTLLDVGDRDAAPNAGSRAPRWSGSPRAVVHRRARLGLAPHFQRLELFDL